MGSAFHQLCPRYSGTLTPTAPTAIRLWDTFTFTFLAYIMQQQISVRLKNRHCNFLASIFMFPENNDKVLGKLTHLSEKNKRMSVTCYL